MSRAESTQKKPSKRERINPKTGKREYKARYSFWANGKKHDADTGWFPTKAQAEKEAKALKTAKERADASAVMARRDKTLETVFDEYILYLEGEAKKEIHMGNVSYFKSAKTIKKTYMPKIIKETQVKDVSPAIFKNWIRHINDQDLGGERVRAYCLVVRKFNEWMDKNLYYTDVNLAIQNRLHMQDVELKPVKEGNREEKPVPDRNILTLPQFMKLAKYYSDKGLGKFENFYWFTIFHVMFFGGMRVEELVALQWKNVLLEKKKLRICNAISEQETVDHALERVRKKEYKTKNKASVRKISILEYYYPLLVDYKESFQYQFKLSNEEVEEAFLFPNLAKHDPNIYQSHKTIVRHLKSACKELGLPETDSQMMRHSCATFLVSQPPDGFGIHPNKIKRYFGHTSSKMIETIYGKLDAEKEEADVDLTLEETGLFVPPAETPEEKLLKEKKQEVLDMVVKTNEAVIVEARRSRVFGQIDEAIKRGQTEYFYNPKDKPLIDEYTTSHPTLSLSFVEAVA